MTENSSLEIWTILTAGFGTLAIYSFLIKENPFYRFFEHIFIGIAAGYMPVYALSGNLWPRLLEPMFGFDIIQFPDGTSSAEYNPYLLLYFIPMCFGVLYYFIYSRRYSWLAKIVIGFSLGASAGLAFKGFFAEIIPQLITSFKPLLVYKPIPNAAPVSVAAASADSIPYLILYFTPLLAGLIYYFVAGQRHTRKTQLLVAAVIVGIMALTFDLLRGAIKTARNQSMMTAELIPPTEFAAYESISNVIFVITLLSVLYYFFFSFRGQGRGLNGVSYAGRWLMMVCFGAFFGSTVMARMALLVERLQFLIDDWWRVVTGFMS